MQMDLIARKEPLASDVVRVSIIKLHKHLAESQQNLMNFNEAIFDRTEPMYQSP